MVVKTCICCQKRFALKTSFTSWEYNVYWLFMQTESKATDWTLSFPEYALIDVTIQKFKMSSPRKFCVSMQYMTCVSPHVHTYTAYTYTR